MISKLRSWPAALGLVIVLCAAVGLFVYSQRSTKLTPGQMYTYLPKSDLATFYVDVRAIRQSGLLEKMAGGTVTEEPEYKTFVQETGFNYKTDLDSVLSGVSSSPSDDTKLYLIQGRFDWDRLFAYPPKHGGNCSNGLCEVPGSVPGRILSFYKLDRNLLAFASGRDSSAARQIDKPSANVQPADVPAQPVWAILPATILQGAENLPSGTRLFARAFQHSDRVQFTLGPLENRFELAVDVTCKNAEEAVRLRSELEGLTVMLQKLISREKQTPNPNDLSGILTSGSFQRVNQHVMGHWPIPRAFLESLGS